MTAEMIKMKLKSVRSLNVRLLALQQRMDEIAGEIDGISATNYSVEKVKCSVYNYVEEKYVRCMDRLKNLQNEYEAVFNNLSLVEDELEERMKRLNTTEYKIIYERYIHGVYPVSIRNMARKLGSGYSEDMVKKAQQRAFKKMADKQVST